MTNRTVAIETLGCKVNQYESSYLLERLDALGIRPVAFRERADIYLVHSCAVTSRAGFETRQLLRRARRSNPEALVVALGCGAQLEPDRLAEERLATHILGNVEKCDLPDWLEFPGTFAEPCRATSALSLCTEFRPLPIGHMHSGRARVFLKLQDGCNAFCSYCTVPHVRGRSRSLPADEVLLQIGRFVDAGYQEVVLTGIHLGQWGKDLDPAQDLSGLLRLMDRKPLPCRIRLSSLEPMEWSGEMLSRLPSWSWICHHFHIPLQSGDDEILERMHRPYTPRDYAALIEELHWRFPEAALGADVLVGFPGETERHFRNTVELIDRLPLTHLHVFPFSPRPGTSAATMPERITGAELKRRALVLRELGARKRLAFSRRRLGTCVDVLVETEIRPGWWQGTSSNYVQVIFPAAGPVMPGSILPVRLTRITPQGVLGEQ